jgi:putative addiction module component (TIGR02574 family)
MKTPNTPIDLSNLSPADRIHLVQDLWDSIHDDALAMPLTAEQRAELQRRDADMESGALQGMPWEEVKKSLLTRR